MLSKRIVIPGKPQGKARPRVTRYGTYTPESTKRYEELIRACWLQQADGWCVKEGPKVAADALNGWAFTDDKQIVSMSIQKFYAEEPRLEVVLYDE